MENDIVNLMNSVLKHFSVPCLNSSFPLVDGLLKDSKKHIVIIVLDGMGSFNMQYALYANGFFMRNKICDYYSVFPPTTVAATASYDSALYPSQHARLGWTMHYPELNQNVEVYSNKNDDGLPAASFNAAEYYTPYVSVQERIKKTGAEAYVLSPYGEPFIKSYDEILDNILDLTQYGKPKYIYAYWPEPDSIMHKKGVMHPDVIKNMRELESKTEAFALKLKNAYCFVSADHGHIDGKGCVLSDYPDILENLSCLPSIEPRTLNLFAKAGKKEALKKAFEAHFKDSFTLYTKEEALESELFGRKPYNKSLEKLLGDFIAAANTDLTIFNTVNQLKALKGVHAGNTEEEKKIPLILLQSAQS